MYYKYVFQINDFYDINTNIKNLNITKFLFSTLSHFVIYFLS